MSPINMWQQTNEMAKAHEGNGAWIKLANDGDRAVVVFLGEPFPREVTFLDGKYVPFTEALKAQGAKSTLRVAINAALFDTKEVKVLEMGVVLFKDLCRVRDKYGLEKWAFEVQRHGAAKDPKTTYGLLPEVQLTAEQQREFAALVQHDLAKVYAEGATATAGTVGSYDGTANGLVDAATAQSLANALKALPRTAVDRFLAKFQVKRIRDLPASQAEKAKGMVEQMEAEFRAPPAAPDTSLDPFA